MRRRQFLVGAGGATLAIPFLSSLLARSAASAAAPRSRRITLFRFGHNTMNGRWLDPAVATTPVGSLGAHEVALSSLDGPVGDAMDHPTYESLRRRGAFTMLRGLDCVAYGNGHGAHALSGAQNSFAHNGSFHQSIDTVLEESDIVYPEGTPVEVLRAVRCRSSGVKRIDPAAGWDADASAFAQVTPPYRSALGLYEALFGSFEGDTMEASGPDPVAYGVIQRVHESYRATTASRRISRSDRLRLEEHIAHLRDVERRIAGTGNFELGCSVPDAPAGPRGLDYSGSVNAYLQLMALAIKCGLSRVLSMGFEGHSIGGDTIPALPDAHLHNDIFHNGNGYSDAEIAQHYVAWKRWHMDKIAEHFVAPLDVEEADTGRSYLDNGVVAMLSESGGLPDGAHSHRNTDYMPILLGSLGGYLRSDRLVAYPKQVHNTRHYGLPYNMFLVTLLQGMGLQPEDYRQGDNPGFGIFRSSRGGYEALYSSVYTQPLTEIVS